MSAFLSSQLWHLERYITKSATTKKVFGQYKMELWRSKTIYLLIMLSFYHRSSHTSPTVEFNVVSSTLGKDTGLSRQKYFLRITLECSLTPEMVDQVVHDIQHGRGDVVK